MTRLAGIVLVCAAMLFGHDARAQSTQFQLGLSDGMILNVMAQNGYHDVDITKKKLTKAQAEGCKGGNRYKVEINLDGRIKKAVPIGNCRRFIGPQTARGILRQKGYRQISVYPEGPQFAAVACRGDRRFRIVISPLGDIQHEKFIGRCANNLSEYDVAAILRARGFSRIKMQPVRRGNYGVEACRGDDKVGLVVDRAGVVVREQKIGRCDPPIHPASIPFLLSRFGISRVEVVDRRLPRYLAHGCRGNDRIEIAMNRFGEMMDERRIGRCDPPLTGPMLEQRLRNADYTGVKIVEQRNNGFTAEVCEDAALLRIDLTIFGETVSQTSLGDCPTQRVGEVIADFERQGLSEATLYIEGCQRRGRRVRIELDRTGEEVNRAIVGRCR
jgi:hypothetical protein